MTLSMDGKRQYREGRKYILRLYIYGSVYYNFTIYNHL